MDATAQTTATDLTVAQTILGQLGGNRFARMTGARNFVGSSVGLSFKLPRGSAHCGINCVSVVLKPNDTYTVQFLKTNGPNVRVVQEREMVYCDQLEGLFTRVTGLFTRLF